MGSDDDIERLGDHRAPADAPPDRFVELWQATDHMRGALDALHDAVAELFDEDELIAQAPGGEHVKVDMEHERGRMRTLLDKVRDKLDEIEGELDDGGKS